MPRTAVKIMLISVLVVLAAVVVGPVFILLQNFELPAESLGGQFIIIFLLEVFGMVILLSPFVSIISISRHGQKPFDPKNAWVVWLPFILFVIAAFAAIVIWPLNGVSREGLFWYAIGAEICGMILFSVPALCALYRK